MLEGWGPLSCWKEHWLYENVHNSISFRFRKQNLSYWISSGLKNICQNLTEECVMCAAPASPSFPAYICTHLFAQREDPEPWRPDGGTPVRSPKAKSDSVFLLLVPNKSNPRIYPKKQIKPHYFLASLATAIQCRLIFVSSIFLQCPQQSSLPESCFSSFRCVLLVLSLLKLR